MTNTRADMGRHRASRASRSRNRMLAVAAVLAASAAAWAPASAQDTTTTESTTTTTWYPDAPTPAPTVPPIADPDCPSPYLPVDYQASLDGDWVEPGPFPTGVSGTSVAPRNAEVFWDTEISVVFQRVDEPGDGAYLLTVAIGDTTRTFTTAGLPLGTHYTRSESAWEHHGVGAFELFVADSGETYVIFNQFDSGTYASFAWRWDDPCVGTLSAAAGAAPGTSVPVGPGAAVATTPRYTG